jgi:hypothetical protein
MEEFELFVSTGESVGVVVIIPAFQPRPAVIIWGERIFSWRKKKEQYRECFSVVAVQHRMKEPSI